MEEGLQWGVKVNNPEDVRAQRINKSLAALLTLRSASGPLSLPPSSENPPSVWTILVLMLSFQLISVHFCTEVDLLNDCWGLLTDRQQA